MDFLKELFSNVKEINKAYELAVIHLRTQEDILQNIKKQNPETGIKEFYNNVKEYMDVLDQTDTGALQNLSFKMGIEYYDKVVTFYDNFKSYIKKIYDIFYYYEDDFNKPKLTVDENKLFKRIYVTLIVTLVNRRFEFLENTEFNNENQYFKTQFEWIKQFTRKENTERRNVFIKKLKELDYESIHKFFKVVTLTLLAPENQASFVTKFVKTDVDSLKTVLNNLYSQQYDPEEFKKTFDSFVQSQGGAKSRKKQLDKCTVSELKERAKARKLVGYSKMNKAELIAALRRR